MEILKYAAFSSDPAGGNPAGVVLDASTLDASGMAEIARTVGYSETAFVTFNGPVGLTVRYFSPKIEVTFCGHATIALAVAYADRHGVGDLVLDTGAGVVRVSTNLAPDGRITATLVSVPTRTEAISSAVSEQLLAALHWANDELLPGFPVRAAYAGAWHPVVAARSRERLSKLEYDVEKLSELMALRNWSTIQLVWQESPTTYHARNPFPVGGVYEDPATGAAAAALGGYLRELALVSTPTTVTVHQGLEMGRPGVITVGIPADAASGIAVSGTAVQM